MSASQFASRRLGILHPRAARTLVAALSTALLALVVVPSVLAAEPVDMGDAHDYSVVANAVTSTGATAMSDNLGSTAPVAGTPIVLGETHIGSAADAAKASMNLAYGDAQLRPSTGALPADLAGASFGPGVYNAPGAMGFTASGVLTLTGDQDAVFIFQIGGALSVGASVQVKLEGGALPCNVFWQVNGATTIGASSKFAGTLMASADITVGADSRVDGRVLSPGAVTLASNAIRTACTETVVVPGPAGPAGPAGPEGPEGATGPAGAAGADGPAGVAGAQGIAGEPGLTGAAGLMGEIGLTGAAGLMGATGMTGATGLTGATGPAGIAPVAGTTTTLCVTKKASRHTVRPRGLVSWTIVVENCGERVASRVTVSDRLRKGATFTSRGGGSLVGRQLSWHTGKLAPGARRTYTVTTGFSPNARSGRYVNRATADGGNTAPATGQGSTTVK